MADLPYLAEYAKSDRSSCKGCKNKIDRGALRIAVMVQSAFHDGKQPNWHHEECFFKKQRPKTASDIGKLNTLRHADQKRIKETIESSGFGIVMPVEKGKGKGKAAKRGNADPNAAALRDFAVEYSKSSRATCRVCEIKICKDEVRISKTVYDTEIGQKYGGQPLWHHVKCFAEDRENLLFLAGGESLPGFKNLTKEDMKMVKEAIKPMKNDEIPVKKLKEEPKDEKEIKEEQKMEKKLEKQYNNFDKYRSKLQSYSISHLKTILEANNQEPPASGDECRERVADCMMFGALEPCPECKNGQLVLDVYGYKCTGYVNDWVKCTNVTRNPKRKKMTVPKAFVETSAFTKYKPKLGERLFEAAPPPSIVIVKKEEPTNGVKKERPIPPMKNLQFFIQIRGKQEKEAIKHRVLKLGGLVVSQVTDTTAAVISNEEQVKKMAGKMSDIKQREIEVVDEKFLDLIDPDKGTVHNTLQLIKQYNIAEWGSDPTKRVPQDVLDGKSIQKSGSMYKSKSTTKKLILKGGTAVDPDSNLEDVAHVYKDYDGTKYTVVLGRTDVVEQKNSYYKLQLLEADSQKKYWLFRSWGRIGTTIGSNKLENFKSLEDAKEQFESVYMERTENPWEMRHDFMKVPGCYYPIEVDYENDEPQTAQLAEDSSCSLPMPVQKLILKIFDINSMKKTMLEFELDTEKMPLGKLSKKQIKAGYKVLSSLLTKLEKDNASTTDIVGATNSFFTLIPHDFGVNNPPLLDNVDVIKTKTAMLDNLLEIEIAYSLLKTEGDNKISPIESHYLKLKAEIAPLLVDCPEYQMILQYVKNTHGSTHTMYTLGVEQVFKVVREGEDKRYKPFRKLHNRRLLWHGSRVTNFAGILSQGLRIAPPEAPVTGYMFGKGVYFADMVSKSANYCCTNKSDPTGIMLLCEVALGNMKECTRSEHVTKLPGDQHSVWGMGKTQPDPAQDLKLDDGTIVPCGTPVQRNINTALLYNEFIVYDVAQVNVKYLVQLKFDYKF